MELSLSPIDGTRHGRNNTMSTLDYIMASPGMEVSDTECLHQLSQSDHELIAATVVANFTERNFKKRPAGNRILSKEATLETISAALKKSDWPFIPFNKVAGIGELLITPITHKQSPLVVKRAMAALEATSTPSDFAAKVRDIKKEDFDNLLLKLPEEMR